jgi:hypothetical protein
MCDTSVKKTDTLEHMKMSTILENSGHKSGWN